MASWPGTQYTLNHLRWGGFVHAFHPKRLRGHTKGPGLPFPDDWRASARHTAFLRYSHDGNDSFAPPGLGDLPSDWNVNTKRADSGVFSLISVLTSASANEFHYSMTYWSNSNSLPTAAQCPAPCYGLGMPMITVYGVNDFALGNASNAPRSRLVRRHIFVDNVSSQKGRHSLKLGGYWESQKGSGRLRLSGSGGALLTGDCASV